MRFRAQVPLFHPLAQLQFFLQIFRIINEGEKKVVKGDGVRGV